MSKLRHEIEKLREDSAGYAERSLEQREELSKQITAEMDLLREAVNEADTNSSEEISGKLSELVIEIRNLRKQLKDADAPLNPHRLMSRAVDATLTARISSEAYSKALLETTSPLVQMGVKWHFLFSILNKAIKADDAFQEAKMEYLPLGVERFVDLLVMNGLQREQATLMVNRLVEIQVLELRDEFEDGLKRLRANLESPMLQKILKAINENNALPFLP